VLWFRTPKPSTKYIRQQQRTMPPKGSRKSAIAAPRNSLVLDNGGYTLKAGIVSSGSTDLKYDDCSVIPNCIARSTRDKCSYTGSELDGCKDFGELAFRRPVEKGFIVNWEAEKAIWEHEFTGGTAGEQLRVGAQLPHLWRRIEAHD
jgi:actin-related protein 6